MRSRIPRLRRRSHRLLTLGILLVASLVVVAPAGAATNLQTWLQDDTVILANPAAALQQLRGLGVSHIRLTVRWSSITPGANSSTKPKGFNDTNPASYLASGWKPYDTVIRDASAEGIAVTLDLAGPEPVWASGPGHPTSGRGEVEWMPNPKDYEDFYKAVATRYSGHYKPAGQSALPRITFWTVWNEANYGPGLSPQGLPSNPLVQYAPTIYRGLVNAAWTALHQTGHGSDTFVFGEITPRGVPNPQQPHATWGLFRFGILPIQFVTDMYCLTGSYKPIRGKLATEMGCPTTNAQTAKFKSQNPALFSASGFSIHPYSKYFPPNVETPNDKFYASLADISNLTTALDKSNAAYHSSKKFPIYNTEYGYITSPPKPHHDFSSKPATYYVYTATAAIYMNFAAYLSYKNPRIQNYMQYLLVDPVSPTDPNFDHGGYASGIEAYGGTPKPGYYAYRMPFYMPAEKSGDSVPANTSLEVWGGALPAYFAKKDVPGDPEAITIQYAPAATPSTFTNFATIPLNNPYGYYDTHLKFPGAGTVREVWQYPTNDLRLVPGSFAPSGFAISRSITVS